MEMFSPATEGYQDIDSDNSAPKWQETRKTKLTLRQIRKLRKMLDIRNYERKDHIEKVRDQYGVKAEPASPGF